MEQEEDDGVKSEVNSLARRARGSCVGGFSRSGGGATGGLGNSAAVWSKGGVGGGLALGGGGLLHSVRGRGRGGMGGGDGRAGRGVRGTGVRGRGGGGLVAGGDEYGGSMYAANVGGRQTCSYFLIFSQKKKF